MSRPTNDQNDCVAVCLRAVAVWCSVVLSAIAVSVNCCSVLQRVAVSCNDKRRGFVAVLVEDLGKSIIAFVLQYVAVCCSKLQCVAVCCSVLQCVAVCCSMLHHVALCFTVLQCCCVLQRADRTF